MRVSAAVLTRPNGYIGPVYLPEPEQTPRLRHEILVWMFFHFFYLHIAQMRHRIVPPSFVIFIYPTPPSVPK